MKERGQLGRLPSSWLPSPAKGLNTKTYDGNVRESYQDEIFYCEEAGGEEDQQEPEGRKGGGGELTEF